MDTSWRRSRRSTTTLTGPRLFKTDSTVAKEKTDIQTFLAICMLNWTQYSEDEKRSIISTLPATYRTLNHDENGALSCPISPDFVAGDKILRDQIALFKRNIRDGFYTKTWQERARKAVEERAAGKFDDYLAKHAEEMFAEAGGEDDVGDIPHSSDGEFQPRKDGRATGADGSSEQVAAQTQPRISTRTNNAEKVSKPDDDFDELV